MFDTTYHDEKKTQTYEAAVAALKQFVESHRDALLYAADLLGGIPGLRVARAALEGLQDPSQLSRRTIRELERVLDLLKLENISRQDTIEAESFARIDPLHPCIEEICLLADQLSERLLAVREGTRPSPAAVSKKVAA